MISYYLYLLAAFGTRHLPRPISKALRAMVTAVFYLFRRRIRNNVKRNLEILCEESCSPYAVFHNFSRTISDFLALDPRSPHHLDGRCDMVGLEHLDGALERGRGAILFTPHLGPWEVAGACLAAKGYRINTIAREHPSRRVTEFFTKRRRDWGIEVFSTGEGVGRLIEALRRGNIVVLLVDRRFSTKGVPLDFFGKKVMLPQGHVALANRTGASLLPSTCCYGESDSVTIRIESPIEPSGESVREIAQQCIHRIEGFIRDNPEQWFAFDHLWTEVVDE
jgi:KDO2-lipid IV(A) lauroyltransferase